MLKLSDLSKFEKVCKASYKKTLTYKIEKLVSESVKWERKQKIANGKLCKIQKKIKALLIELGQGK